MRINQYLAHKGVASRREADRLIEAGKVTLNGRLAVLGDQVKEGDKVSVDQSTLDKKTRGYAYLAFNKPIGIVTNPEPGQKSVTDLINFPAKLVPVGRLDKDSYGLIILSNDSRITGRLLDSENDHEKEYRVTVDKSITPMFQKDITSGLRLEDFTAKPCKINKISPTEFFISLTEGKKHQIRRMCAALGYQVKDLERVRILNIKLGNLRPGQYREFEESERKIFLKSLGL